MKRAGFSLFDRKGNTWMLVFLILVSAFVGCIFLWRLGLNTNASDKDVFALLFSILGIFGGYAFFIYKQQIDETKLFMDLFRDFNARYDKLNDSLGEIFDEETEAPLRLQQKLVLADYFNLCAEEHMFFKAGYIDPMVWDAWRKGISIYLCDARIKEVFEQELKTGSYYKLNIDEILV